MASDVPNSGNQPRNSASAKPIKKGMTTTTAVLDEPTNELSVGDQLSKEGTISQSKVNLLPPVERVENTNNKN